MTYENVAAYIDLEEEKKRYIMDELWFMARDKEDDEDAGCLASMLWMLFYVGWEESFFFHLERTWCTGNLCGVKSEI